MDNYRIFAYDPGLDDGAFFPVGDVSHAVSESEAVAMYKARNSRAREDDGRQISLIARGHQDRARWPDPMTGRLPAGGR